ncbi:AbrB family transcriptional regulator [Ruegeria pomeroyi]|uniref:AbrB family transcriptional regulator n=1 Tax=Ruegeria pomeroyi TaxID=89184 RepID=A0A9Q3WKW3_9RHOB|nr:AbrB family transcriptional regulator [Ruegeria pomeroyi]
MILRFAELRRDLLTLAVGTCGALVAALLHFPMALLAGPAVLVSLAGLSGLSLHISPRLRDAGFLIVGLSIGSMVSPESIEAMMRWPVAFGLLAGLTLVTPWAGRWLIPRLLPIDRDEAFLAAAPGHLSLVIALADSLHLSLTRPVVLASIRLMALTLLVPLAATMAGIEIGPGLPQASVVTPWAWILGQLVAALLLAPLLKAARLPAHVLIAGILVAATTHLAGWTAGGLPGWAAQAALVLMGTLIGTRFGGMGWHELHQSLTAGLAIVTVTTGLAALVALPASYLSGLPLLDVLLGFSPGGLETMIILSAALGADPSFVAAAHLFRLSVLAVVLTLYATNVARRAAGKSDGQR